MQARSRSLLALQPGMVAFLGCMLAASAARFTPIHRFAGADPADYRVLYLPLARNLTEGHGFTNAEGEFVTRVPPGYPLYLAACLFAAAKIGVDAGTLVALADVLCAGLSGWLLWRIGARLWGDRTAVVVAGTWALYPIALWLYSAPSTEAPYMVLLMLQIGAALLVVLGAEGAVWLAFACGAAGGIGALVRPFSIGLPLLFALWTLVILWRRDGRTAIKLAAWMVLGYGVSVAPWEIYAYSKTAHVIPLSTAGAPTMRDGLIFAVNDKRYRLRLRLPQGVLDVMEHIRASTSSSDAATRILRVVGEEFRHHPLQVTELMLLKAVRSMYGTDSRRYEGVTLTVQAIYVLALGMAWKRARRGSLAVRRAAELVGIIAIYSLVMDIVGASIVRYLVPAMLPACLVVPALWLGDSTRGQSREGE